jgi:hypothetical protein
MSLINCSAEVRARKVGMASFHSEGDEERYVLNGSLEAGVVTEHQWV